MQSVVARCRVARRLKKASRLSMRTRSRERRSTQRQRRAALQGVPGPVKRHVYSSDMRNSATRLYLRLQSCRRVADLLGISKSTVARWVHEHPLTRARRTPWKKVKSAVEESIRASLRGNPCVTTASLKATISATLHLHLSDECVRLTRISMGFTRKKVSRVVSKPGLHELRQQFEEERTHVSTDEVISIDESSFWFDMKPAYGYSKRGHRLHVDDHYKKAVRWTLLLAVSNERVLGWKLYDASTTSQSS